MCGFIVYVGKKLNKNINFFDELITNDEIEIMSSLYPDGCFFFNSNVFKNISISKFELTKVYRQDDQKLINLLDKVRNASLNEDDLLSFNKRIVDRDWTVPEEVLTLSTNNSKVNSINASNLKNIDSKEYIYNADIEGKYTGAPVDAELKIKVGAQVMLVKNGENWVNGTLAIIDSLSKDEIHINLVDGKNIPIPHFGVVLEWNIFHKFSKELITKGVEFVIEPYTRFKGQTGEQATMFFLDPAGNALEFKSFKDLNKIFEK